MTELKLEVIDSWVYLKDNFSINKCCILLCFIGSDHALKPENKTMKLTQNQVALHHFSLVARFLSAVLQ